jgi:uncharacterized iron-regulated protein
MHPMSTLPSPRIVATRDGRGLELDALLDALEPARVVYVGERHDRAADHAAQLAIFRALHARAPSIALGLEMVQRPRQDALDAYVAHGIEEPALLERVEWRERWGFDFAMYRPLFEYAREHGLRIVGLNAPTELTRAVSRGGLDALEPEQRALLPELDLSNATHRAMFDEAMREHPGLDEARRERFYAAQVIWDETMAETIARTLSGAGAPHRMMVLAGAMHVRPSAIPERASRRGAGPYRVVVPVAEDELEEALRSDPPLGDFLWVTPRE